MAQKLEKRTFLGIDTTPRFWLWDEIARLDEECSTRQARIEQLETQAGTFAHQRNESDRKIKELEEQLREANLRLSKANQPRKNGKFSGKYDKPAK